MEKQPTQLSEKKETSQVETETEQEPSFEGLDFRTTAFLKEHIDIAELADFDPRWELRQMKNLIASMPRGQKIAQRRSSLEHFKEKLKKLRINLSKAQLQLENFIREHPDSIPEELDKVVRNIVQRNGVESQEADFRNAAKKYLENKGKVKEVVGFYKDKHGDSWQEKLFENLFGRLPHGQIKIEIMPMTLYFKIYNISDYALANGGIDEDIARASGGVMLLRTAIWKLDGKVLIENTASITSEFANIVKIHEEEHAIHKIYPTRVFIKNESVITTLFHSAKEKITQETFEERLRRCINSRIPAWQAFSESEVLSYLKTGESALNIKSLLLDESESGLYFYLRVWGEEKEFVEGVLAHFEKAKPEIVDKNGRMLDEDVIDELSVKAIQYAWDIYRESIEKAMESVEWLLKKYPRDEVLRLLSQEPLNKWHRLRRILS